MRNHFHTSSVQIKDDKTSLLKENSSRKAKNKSKLRIFLSYSSRDGEIAGRIYNAIRKIPDIEVFYSGKINPGENWENRIKKELEICDIVIILLSEKSINSQWIMYELGAAWGLNKRIIPVVTNFELISEIPLELHKYKIFNLDDFINPELINGILMN